MYRKMFFRCLAVVVCLVMVHLCAGSAAAQLSPPISPWMSMFQRRTGPLDNYNALVKPQQEALRNYQNQQQDIQRNQQAVQTLQQGGSAGGIDLMGRSSSAPLDPNRSLLQAPREMPSGQSSAAYYNNHLHYYQNLQQNRVPNFSSPGANRRR
ncbi:MAG: hypothetical protein LBT46_10745 [Planctomycetaceae bacterium]|jgi:hypothetical protein|nr:hypothetical protein [Planctomycetaceae bacterium]